MIKNETSTKELLKSVKYYQTIQRENPVKSMEWVDASYYLRTLFYILAKRQNESDHNV